MSHSTDLLELKDDTSSEDIRLVFEQTIEAFEHFLPAQAPIKDFVHHNTLHGFQHLPFQQALKAATDINGAKGYIDESRFREFFKQGRINQDDLNTVLADYKEFDLEKIIYQDNSVQVSTLDLISTFLIYDLSSISLEQLSWQNDELDCLARFQENIKPEQKQKLIKLYQVNTSTEQLNSVRNKNHIEALAIADLWQACIDVLNIDGEQIHPEVVLSKSLDRQANHHKMQKQAANDLAHLLEQVGDKITISGLLKKLTGKNIIDDIRPVMIKQVSSFLDLGFAPFHLNRSKGFYQAWRDGAASDLSWLFNDLDNWDDMLESLPDNSFDTVVLQLRQLGIKPKHWSSYLNRLVMEIPGWSGMFFWRHQNQNYAGLKDVPVDMMDYIAVLLVMERMFAQKLCNINWQFDANLDMFRWYFRRQRSEFMLRYEINNEQLPEYLSTEIRKLLEYATHSTVKYANWQKLADILWCWKDSNQAKYSINEHAWQLFLLAQYQAIPGVVIRSFSADHLDIIFNTFTALNADKRSFIWLQAYEVNYRDTVLNMLVNNRHRGNWQQRETQPQAQTIFCMDDREEAFRRHLEEINPQIETFGAAAHYNVFIDYKGITDDGMTRLCPVVAVPAHEVHEHPSSTSNTDLVASKTLQQHTEKLKQVSNQFFQNTRLGIVRTAALIAFSAPASFLALVGKTLLPQKFDQVLNNLLAKYIVPVDTAIDTEAKEVIDGPTPDNRQVGFSDNEQADRLETFLRNIGLIHHFSPLVVIFGHGSISKNNPHLAAYDCGACSGRHSGANARTLAQFANRKEVRDILAKREIHIPLDCLFIGAEHNTCDESIIWYDIEKATEQFKELISILKKDIDHVCHLSAHERCRRLASAPKQATLTKSLSHISERAVDFSQARPELGHATNACAFIGRRHLTQGAFLDRRSFLISYNPEEDADGTIVERLLLANGPVGAGISLEYYFSTVDNDCYGSGSKVTHNVSGLFGVMDGVNSDLRTGLPKQMIEIHEAMRLQVIVEASVEMLTKIYTRQPPLQELVGNGWLLLCSVDPDSGEIFVFTPDKGFTPWEGQTTQLPVVDKSQNWYDGYECPLQPALIKTPSEIAV